jgi:hypothetical protein
LLKNSFPHVIFRKFKGRPTGGEYDDLDLIFVNPQNAGSTILDLLLEAFGQILVKRREPDARVSIPRHELRIELGQRRQGVGTETLLNNSFETPTKKLVALLRFDAIDPRWLSGTQARINPKSRFAFFISRGPDLDYRGHRGILLQGPQ